MNDKDKILKALEEGACTGFDLINKVKMWSGTFYPVIGQLEVENLVESFWEDPKPGRPRHRLYRLKEQNNGNQ